MKAPKTTKQRIARENYLNYIKSSEWKIRKFEFIKSFDFTCAYCKKKFPVYQDYKLTIQHLHYDVLGYEEKNDVRCICWDCCNKLSRLKYKHRGHYSMEQAYKNFKKKQDEKSTI